MKPPFYTLFLQNEAPTTTMAHLVMFLRHAGFRDRGAGVRRPRSYACFQTILSCISYFVCLSKHQLIRQLCFFS